MTDVEIVSHFPTNVFNYRKRLRSTTGESGVYVDPVVAFESKCETQLSETNPRQETIFSKALEPLSTAHVLAPFDYICSLQSKAVRSQLIDALNVWIQVNPASLKSVKSLVGDIHNISLILDDVQDNSPLRRSQPAAHTIFGVGQTVNSATYKIVDVISQAARAPAASEIVPIVLEGMGELMRGQGLDLLWTHQVLIPSAGDYIRMVDGKTGGLFRMIPQLMKATSSSGDGISGVVPPLENFMTLLGRYFQIRDDYANLASDKYSISKGFCEDLDEGKCSFVLLHALNHSSPSAREILRHMMFQRRAAGHTELAQKELTLRLMKEAGSLNYTLHVLGLLQDEILVELDKIEAHTGTPNPLLRQLISALVV